MSKIKANKKFECERCDSNARTPTRLDSESIYVNGISIFVPSEYESFKAAIPKKRHKALFELSTITGMRYVKSKGCTIILNGIPRAETRFDSMKRRRRKQKGKLKREP